MALIFSLDIRYLFIVRKSRLVRISKRSMMNPCGLLSERTELESSQLVMSERSVILLSRIINCRAYVLTWVAVEIAYYGIHLDTLVDVARDDSVVITFFLHILIICVSAPVTEEKRPMYVVFDCCGVG